MLKKGIFILIGLVIIIITAMLLLWTHSGMVELMYRKTFYSQHRILEEYFYLPSGSLTEILQYSFAPDRVFVWNKAANPSESYYRITPYILSAEILVDEDLVDYILNHYGERSEFMDYSEFVKERFDITLGENIDFYINSGSSVNCWTFPMNWWNTSQQAYIYVSVPDQGKCHIFLLKNMIGWNLGSR